MRTGRNISGEHTETPGGQTDGLDQRQDACQSRAGARDSGVAASEGPSLFLKVSDHASYRSCCGNTCTHDIIITRGRFIRSADTSITQ